MTIVKSIFWICILLSSVIPCSGFAADAPFVLKTEKDRIMLRATDIPLREILTEVVNQTGIRIIVHGELDGLLSVDFSDLPLEEGLKRLVKEFNYVFIYEPGKGKSGAPSVTEVIIYSKKGEFPKRSLEPRVITRQGRSLQEEEESPEVKEATFESLVKALEDKDPEVREEAVDNLGESEDERAVTHLTEVLLKDRDADVREVAAEALGEIGDARAISALIQVLQDRDPGVRESAVDALAEIGGDRAIESLMGALQDEDEDVREAAVDALEEITGKDFGR